MDNAPATKPVFTEVERPAEKEDRSELGEALMKTIETGKALCIPLSISPNPNAFKARIQSLARHRGVQAHTRKADGEHMIVWFTKRQEEKQS